MEEMELRIVFEKARMTARTAIVVASVFVEKNEGCCGCSLVVSGIRREEFHDPEVTGGLYSGG
jgi:hypothetical protein